MRKILSRLVLVAALSVLLATNLSVPASADGFGHDAVVKYASGGGPATLKVCKNWAPDNSGCAKSSPTGKLKHGQNSKKQFGWDDADGFFLPAGYYATWSGLSGKVTGFAGSPGWVKLGGLFGRTWVVTLHANSCPAGGCGGGGGGGW